MRLMRSFAECHFINPATKYVVFWASSMPLIKAWLAKNGHSIVKNRNAEQGHD
jgi:hypothetical protein